MLSLSMESPLKKPGASEKKIIAIKKCISCLAHELGRYWNINI